jgi:glutamate-ammonia-ligase adenylyltransferase
MTARLIDRIATVQVPFDEAAAKDAFASIVSEREAGRLVDLIWRNSAASALLQITAASSPYLRDLIARDPEFAYTALTEPPEELFAKLSAKVSVASSETSNDFAIALRQLKSKSALLIALADIGGVWTVEQVTEALTQFADAVLRSAVDSLLRDAATKGQLAPANMEKPGEACGYVVLAMGKHGAFELNYSSDIDLIVFYDPETAPLAAGIEPATFFVRLTKRLVTLLQDVTEHGYVYRVDLRLRPDPRATQVAIAIEAAAVYYENQGQNWERAAMIKARPVAGDLALGEEFLARLRPYIWRKYLDYAAIADVQSLKRQIHAVKGHGEIAVQGHNLKLGRGGIREIEFFVQTQQLIAGGRNPKLRGRSTRAMLDALAEAKWITLEAAAELKSAYVFLRKIEHRIQMVADEQTHTLPVEPDAFEKLARFCGFANGKEFSTKLRSTFETVQGHYARLFEDAGELGTEAGSLVFTGGEDDPETLETLRRLGFKEVSEISATIRGWHFGRYPATRSARARELLTEIMPALLTVLARNGDADHAFIAFDQFLGSLSAGVQIFSLIRANPNLLDLLATVLGTAPRLAEQLGRRPKVLDAVIDPGFFGPLPAKEEFKRIADAVLTPDIGLEEIIDRARVVGKEQSFRIGVRILSETVSANEAGVAFSALAEVLLEHLHVAVARDMEQRHGTVRGGRSAIIAMGKLGGREMTAGSDLDLILVYDTEPGAEMSKGGKPVSVVQYYARLTQRLISALKSPTSEGVLYDVDMRLRPSGSAGPVAASLESFRTYQRDSAWTWEKLALTRARPVSGDPSLMKELESAILASLCAKRDAEKTRRDVLDMRRLMAKEWGTSPIWDIKRAYGGLVDVEFIAQFLQLIHAERLPQVLNTTTLTALDQLYETGAINRTDHSDLKEAGSLYGRLTQVLRLCVDGLYDPGKAPAGLNRLVAGAAGVPDISTAEALLADTQSRISQRFESVIGRVREH